jgi:5-methylcytosine-specific restriction enzyme subunit McrC
VTPSIQHLTALEHTPIPIRNDRAAGALSLEDVSALAAIGERRKGFCAVGASQVLLAQYCGIVPLGNRVLEILPKVHRGDTTPATCRGILLRLLRMAGKFPHFSYKTAGQDLRHMPILEIFIVTFLQSVTALIRGGFLRKYESQEDDTRVVRGQINFRRQFGTHANRPDVVACGFDELTADNAWNRVLKRALKVCRPWIASPEVGRQWIEVAAAFQDIKDVQLSARDVALLPFDRHGGRYRSAIEWARWILSLLSPTLRAGENQAPALLFDMNKLFEAAIANLLLQRAAGADEIEIVTQDTSKTFAVVSAAGLVDSNLGIRPDVVVRRRLKVVCIADTKWKRLDLAPDGKVYPSQSDLYQLAAYAHCFGCKDVELIYPWCVDLSAALDTRIRISTRDGEPVSVRIICVSVEEDAMPVLIGTGSIIADLLGTREPARVSA